MQNITSTTSTRTKREEKKIKKAENKNKKNAFKQRKVEMKKLLSTAYKTYKSDLKKYKIEDKKTLKNNYTLWKNEQKEIIKKWRTKQIDNNTFDQNIDEMEKKRNQIAEEYSFSLKNHILLANSEYKRTIVQIQKTYMDVISKSTSYFFKRWLFGINKEFTRVSWWSRKQVLLDFIIIIVIIAIMALLFFGIDMLWMRLK